MDFYIGGGQKKKGVIRRNLCKLCFSCFPLSIGEKIWTEWDAFILVLPAQPASWHSQTANRNALCSLTWSDNHAGFPLLPKSCLKVLCLKNVGNEFLWQLGCCALDARAGNEAARGLCSLWWSSASHAAQHWGTVYLLREGILGNSEVTPSYETW